MAKKLTDYRTKIKNLVRDVGILSFPADYDDGLERSLEWYSKKKPQIRVVDLPSDGSGDFAISLLDGFDEDFSGDPEIEWPISADEDNKVERRYWRFVRTPDGTAIRLTDKPSIGELVRLTFKVPHLIPTTDEGESDPGGVLAVSINDFNAVCNYAGAELCDDLARHFTPTSEHALVDADIADYTSKGREYELRGKALRAKAREHIGAAANEDSGPVAASVTKNLDVSDSRGRDRLTHPRRYR